MVDNVEGTIWARIHRMEKTDFFMGTCVIRDQILGKIPFFSSAQISFLKEYLHVS